MFILLVVFHVLVCIVLILAVLLQSGKGGGLSSAFGGAGPGAMASTMFGGRGATTFLTRATIVLASLYMLIVIGLNLMPVGSQGPRSVIREEALKNQQASPAQGLPAVPGQQQPAAPQPVTPQPVTPGENPPANPPQ
jgi:preprotein translocase subunit SecG